MKSIFLIALISISGCTAQQVTANPITCNVLKISDGDTIRANCEGTIERIRFCGIDAPEKKQELGNKSTALLKQLLNGGKVNIVAIEKDRFGRTVAELFVGDRFINAEMVKAGLAYEYRQFSGKCPNKLQIRNAEEVARKNKIGVWNGTNHQKPWDWRKDNK